MVDILSQMASRLYRAYHPQTERTRVYQILLSESDRPHHSDLVMDTDGSNNGNYLNGKANSLLFLRWQRSSLRKHGRPKGGFRSLKIMSIIGPDRIHSRTFDGSNVSRLTDSRFSCLTRNAKTRGDTMCFWDWLEWHKSAHAHWLRRCEIALRENRLNGFPESPRLSPD